MALQIYRYRATGPGISDLSKEVPSAVTFSAAGHLYVDIQVDDTVLQDLSDAMAARGWTFDSTAPATTPAAQAASLGSDAINILSGGTLVAKQPSLNFVSGATVVNNGGAGRVDVTIPAGLALTANAPQGVSLTAAAVGTGTAAAKDDHVHLLATAAPSNIGTANAAGTATSSVRSDHVHALPFATVQTVLAGATSAIAVNAQKITGLADPTAAQDAATKAYVDATSQGLDVKASVRAISTTNITLSAPQTIDGVSVIAGDRVLVAGQSTASANGIYVVAAGAWTRATDADTSPKVTAGMFTFVTEGTANADSGWVLTTNDAITLGTTALAFTQFSGAGQVVAGAGLTKTGNTLDVIANADGSIVVNADDIQVGVLATDGQHGNRGGGALHANATTSVAGFQSGADKTKLDGITALASTDCLLWGNSSIGNSTTARFLAPGYTDNNAQTSTIQFRVPRAGTIRNLRVRSNTAGTGASNLTFTLRKNGTNQTLTCTYSNTAQDGSDLVNSFTVAAGDLIDIIVNKSASLSNSPQAVVASVEYSA